MKDVAVRVCLQPAPILSELPEEGGDPLRLPRECWMPYPLQAPLVHFECVGGLLPVPKLEVTKVREGLSWPLVLSRSRSS